MPRTDQAGEQKRTLSRGATLEATVSTFRKWLHLPDPTALYAVLGAVAANRLPGDPAWLLLVGAPGGGKTEIVGATSMLPYVHAAATLTEASLLSGTPKREREDTASGGLLRTIGPFGIIVAKDFGSVLSMHRDERAKVLAGLREIYDGSWTRHVGTDGGRTLHWHGKVGLIGGCTPAIDRHQAVMGAMGERFVLLRLPRVDAEQQAHKALEHAGREAEMRAELGAAVAALFEAHDPVTPAAQPGDAGRLVRLATLVVRCRSTVERDGHTREVELIPEPEAPTRLVVVLAQLLAGLRSLGAPEGIAWHVVGTAALDSIPAIRRTIMDALAGVEEALMTAQVAEAVGYPLRTAERALDDLVAHGVVSVHRQGRGRATTWELAEWAAGSYAAATSPEMSEGMISTSPEMSERASLSLCTDSNDKSGEVGSATHQRSGTGGSTPVPLLAKSAQGPPGHRVESKRPSPLTEQALQRFGGRP